ncbi:MAG TPA: hypothetical protein DDW30_09945 [Clostridiales bacterium]|nr:hypothetical protein [Clostridiales bacterium]
MTIPILYEPAYLEHSVWCDKQRLGIEAVLAQKKYTVTQIDGNTYREYPYERLFAQSPRLIILIATSPSWIFPALCFFRDRNIRVILTDSYPWPSELVAAQCAIDYGGGIREIYRYFEAQGCSDIALYGLFRNSTTDDIKKTAFLQECRLRGIEDPEGHCFYNENDLGACYREFSRQLRRFRAVICVNDIVALSLLKHLRSDGIAVPDTLQLITIGGIDLIAHSHPKLSVFTVDHAAIGAQVISLYRYLANADSPSLRLTLKIAGQLIPRETTKQPLSTVPAPSSAAAPLPPPDLPNPCFYHNDEVQTFSKLEKMISICDETDLGIIRHILQGTPYEAIAEDLHLARNTVSYRIRRLANSISLSSRSELKQFLEENYADMF